MKKLKTAIWMSAIVLLLFVSGFASALQVPEIPLGDYEVLSHNADQNLFVLAFTGDFRWQVQAECLQLGVPAPPVGMICNYQGNDFICPNGAQSLRLLGILQQPPPPSPTFTLTPTATATFTSIPTLTTTPMASITPTATVLLPTTYIPTRTPFLPGAPASPELLATISAANEALQNPKGQGLQAVVDWIKWLIRQVLLLFGKTN